MTLKNGVLLLLSERIYVTNLKTCDKHVINMHLLKDEVKQALLSNAKDKKNPVQTSMSRKLQTQYNSKFSILKSGSFTIATALSD